VCLGHTVVDNAVCAFRPAGRNGDKGVVVLRNFAVECVGLAARTSFYRAADGEEVLRRQGRTGRHGAAAGAQNAA